MNKNQQNPPSEQELAQFQLFLKNAKDLICECQNNTFTQATKLKLISKIITGESKDTVIPVPTFLCSKCNKELVFENSTPQNSIIQ